MSTHDKLLQALNAIQQYSPEHMAPLSEDDLAKNVLMKVSGYARLLEETHRKGQAALNIGVQTTRFYANPTSESVAQGFQLGGLALNGINFLRLPTLYLCAYLLGQKMPLTWVDTMHWNYSGVMLGMAVTCLLVPVAAPILAFVMAGTGLAVSSFFLNRAIKQHYALEGKQEELSEAISIAQETMQSIVDEARLLQEQLLSGYDGRALDDDELLQLEVDIGKLKQRYEQQKSTLSALQEEHAYNAQLAEEFSMKNIKRRSVGLALSAIAVIGLVVALFFPPAGVGILTAVALVGAAYTLAPSVIRAGHWIADKIHSLKNPHEGYIPLKPDEPSVIKAAEYSSTTKAMLGLGTCEVLYEAVNPLHKSLKLDDASMTLHQDQDLANDALAPSAEVHKKHAEVIAELSEKIPTTMHGHLADHTTFFHS